MRQFFYVVCLILFYLTPGDAITLRLATEQDRAACEVISEDVYQTVYEPLHLYSSHQDYVDEVSEWLFDRFFSLKHGHLIVAEDDKHQVVGFLYAKQGIYIDEKGDIPKQIYDVLALTPEEQEALAVDSEVYIAYLSISKEWRKKGVGKMLLQSLPTYFPSMKRAYLDSYVSNTQAIGYFQHLGFTKMIQLKLLPELPEESVILIIDAAKLKK